MSIWATWLDISSDREEGERLGAAGIEHGVIGEARDDAPTAYQGSHVLPSDGDERRGFVSASFVPNHVVAARAGVEDETSEALEAHKSPWMRLDVGEGFKDGAEGPMATVLLREEQVRELRDTLTRWLEADEVW